MAATKATPHCAWRLGVFFPKYTTHLPGIIAACGISDHMFQVSILEAFNCLAYAVCKFILF